MKRILVAGLGDLGAVVAARLAAEGHPVVGLRRSSRPGPAGVQVVQQDLRRPLKPQLPPPADAAVICLSPPERSPQSYRETYVDSSRRLLETGNYPRVLLVSSSAVWGVDDGRWVDETDPPEPANWRGEVLLEAEAQVAKLCDEAVAVRLAGIYGPGREFLLRQVRSGEPIKNPRAWTNRIHRDDAAALICSVLRQQGLCGAVTGVDDHPARRIDVLAWLAGRLGLPCPPAGPGDGLGKRLRGRCAQAAGLRLAYPDYRAGYSALLDDADQKARRA